jgi:monoamine oxidase
MQRYFALVDRVDPRSLRWPRKLAAIDRLSAADWLRRMGASPGFIAGIDGMLPIGDGIESVSALSVVREFASIRAEVRGLGASALGRIAGGADHLPRAIAHRIGSRIVYGAEVQRIEHHDNGAVLVVNDRTGRHRIDAARVVLTMPFTVLRQVDVTPPWSRAKAGAIASLGMTSVTRIWVESNRRFWNERGESGSADTDLGIGRIRDETEGQAGVGGILGAYLSGHPARRWGELDRMTLLETAVDELERVHPGIRQHFIGGSAVFWDREPFARGAYPFFAPGQLAQHATAAAASEGVIHFAGDGTSHRPGFMHGAVASAKRVITEILDARRRD